MTAQVLQLGVKPMKYEVVSPIGKHPAVCFVKNNETGRISSRGMKRVIAEGMVAILNRGEYGAESPAAKWAAELDQPLAPSPLADLKLALNAIARGATKLESSDDKLGANEIANALDLAAKQARMLAGSAYVPARDSDYARGDNAIETLDWIRKSALDTSSNAEERIANVLKILETSAKQLTGNPELRTIEDGEAQS